MKPNDKMNDYLNALYNTDKIPAHNKMLMPRPLSNPLKKRISSFSFIFCLPAFLPNKHKTSCSSSIG
ncbi:MAG: hypothetical protein K0R34_3383 [Herbinix sp.]|nr:hypothetical protein [Herbinix sp.]